MRVFWKKRQGKGIVSYAYNSFMLTLTGARFTKNDIVS